MTKSQKNIPLCIDLDGTLTFTDVLVESYIAWLKENPWKALTAWSTLFTEGRSQFKRRIVDHATINATLLPYNEEFITWIKAEHKKGRNIYIATASDEVLGHAVADHLPFIDGVIGSDGARNLAGSRKAEALVEQFGEKGFDYAGNANVDLSVWPHARHAIIVNTPPSVRKKAMLIGNVSKQFLSQTNHFNLRVFLRQIRIHQWVKNLLIFVPLITSHMIIRPNTLGDASLAFISFSLMASSVYLFNDLMDLDADRQHITKRHRPLAAGTTRIVHAVLALIIMPTVSILIALTLPRAYLAVLIAYVVINAGYSLFFKSIPYLDVVILTFLYVLRILAGSAATDIPTSIWLFIFAAFIFLSLALIKRSSELYNLEKQGREKSTGRGYHVRQRMTLRNIGIGSSILSLGVLGFYINSPAVTPLYATPALLWALIPIFGIWVARIWNITLRGDMHEDPVVFATHDTLSYATGLIAFLILLSAV